MTPQRITHRCSTSVTGYGLILNWTNRDWHVIVEALRVAAEQYQRDSESCTAARLARGFEAQADNARKLYEDICAEIGL